MECRKKRKTDSSFRLVLVPQAAKSAMAAVAIRYFFIGV